MIATSIASLFILLCILYVNETSSFRLFSCKKLSSSMDQRTILSPTTVSMSLHENFDSKQQDIAHSNTIQHKNFAHLPLLIAILPSTAYADVGELTASALRSPLDLFVNTLSLFFICRIVLSWYPKTDLTKFPYNIVVWPTEPLLSPVRELVPPAFGVDISSIIWIGLLSFLREILTGQQGVLTLMSN